MRRNSTAGGGGVGVYMDRKKRQAWEPGVALASREVSFMGVQDGRASIDVGRQGESPLFLRLGRLSWRRRLFRLLFLYLHFMNASKKCVLPSWWICRGYVLDMFWICPPLGRLVCTERAFGLRPVLAW